MASTHRRSKRKTLAVMEVVSTGTAQKPCAEEGECFRVSSQAKPTNQLRPSLVEICRTLVSNANVSSSEERKYLDPQTYSFVNQFITTTVTDALREKDQRINSNVLSKIRNDFGITVFSLISEWSKCPYGKGIMERLGNMLNQVYDKSKVQRRVLAGDTLKEIKHLIKGAEANDSCLNSAKELLKVLEETIENTFNMPGDELIALVASFLRTNEKVHLQWSRQRLQDVVRQAQEGKQYTRMGGQWRRGSRRWLQILPTSRDGS